MPAGGIERIERKCCRRNLAAALDAQAPFIVRLLSAERLVQNLRKVGVAGSDSHTMSGVGLTFTEVPGARTVEEYFTGLRTGRGLIHGEHGRYFKITYDIFSFAGNLLRDKPWAAVLLPLTIFIPAVTAGHWLNEIRFCKQWAPRVENKDKRHRMLWDVDSTFEANWAS